MPPIIDLRSDTVTRPTAGMRAAMAAAEVGDDVLGTDPTVERLQARFAEMAGQESALFVPSGTMGNQIALHCLARAGDEVLCDRDSHIVHYETGAPAVISGLTLRLVDGIRGIFTEADVEAAVRPDNVHFARTSVLVVENTHNRGGGRVWPLDRIQEVAEAAGPLAKHLDGARIWNAMAATGIPLADWAAPFDTLTACFSKGLGAPVGSILAGPKDIIARARRVRKMLGGAMRQVGILAAAAEYALDNHVERLAEDHANAQALAGCLSAAGLFDVEDGPATNMVYFSLRNLGPDAPPRFHEEARAAGVWFGRVGPNRFRAVTHLDVSPAHVAEAAGILSRVCAGGSSSITT